MSFSEAGDPAPWENSLQELKGLRILLVEDMPDSQAAISRFLEKRGAQVAFADNGQQGVEKARSLPFDAVLMDIQMPVMNGYEATKILRDGGFRKPIIALTAHGLTESRGTCLKYGCNDFLTKPVDINELVPKILEAIRAERSPRTETLL